MRSGLAANEFQEGECDMLSGAAHTVSETVHMAIPSASSEAIAKLPLSSLSSSSGFSSIVSSMSSPSTLTVFVGNLGSRHLDSKLTPAGAVIFRDAIVDLFEEELGPLFDHKAKTGLISILTYFGAAYLFTQEQQARRVKIINCSWMAANGSHATIADIGSDVAHGGEDNL
mmetsp:Transcript_28559/g.51723  ORF Transcript_28559/g.51723 Transcript_28559/m.51723 type:complete len:171 (+) Transcript_28559:85-597(+)